MKKIALAITAASLLGGAAFAQGPGGGPGPGPVPSPWILNGNALSYNNGGLTLPSTVTGGSQGVGSINVSGGYYVGGIPIVPLSGGTSGTVLQGVTGSAPVWTAAPTLGVAGTTVGSLTFANATSGSIKVQPATGALGTAVATLPAGTYNIVGDNVTQALTGKTYNGLTITTTTGTLTIANGKTLTDTSAVGANLLVGATGGGFVSYAGSSCTNQFVTAVSAAGVFTCNSVGTAYISAGAVTNTTLANSATAATFKGNPTAAAGAQQDFTIQGLTSLASPSSTLDLIPIYNHSTGALNQVTPAAIIGSTVAGVSSVNGLSGALTIGLAPPGGRITPTSAVCLPTSDVTAVTTIYYAPCVNPYVPIYNGTNVQAYSFTSSVTDAVGLSLALGSSWAANTLFDVYVTLNSGTPTLCTNPWTSSSAGASSRNIALGPYSGFLTNGTLMNSCRNSNSTVLSVAANQATYLGTFLTNGTAGQVDFKFGSTAVGGGAAIASIWNAYNQSLSSFTVLDANTSWGVTATGTFQPLDAGATGSGLNNRFTLVTGAGGMVSGTMNSAVNNVSGNTSYIGFGYNATNSIWSRCVAGVSSIVGVGATLSATCGGPVPVGLNFLQAIQYSTSASDAFLGGTSPGVSGINVSWSW